MKQRIRVVGMIREQDAVLLLKRVRGRLDDSPIWELPTGKIAFGEQPEEAMVRTVFDYLGVKTKSLKLIDAVTFVAIEGSSQMGNLYIVYEVQLEKGAKLEPRDRYSAYRYLKNGDGGPRMNEATLAVLAIEGHNGQTGEMRAAANGATVYVDGSSRGNPGPAGVGYYIVGEDGSILKRGGEFIGFATSRVAEYYALKTGCEKALELGLKSVRFVSDNLMLVNQMNGIYKVKNADLLPIYDEIQKLLEKFEACAFVHVNRELNTEADAEANVAIDQLLSGE